MRGLRTKVNSFYLNVLANNYDVIIMTETWLNDTVFDHELIDHRYNVFRRDRSSSSFYSHKKDGGGVMIAILKKFEVIRNINRESSCEDLWITLRLGKNNIVNIYVIYIPPPLNESYIDTFIRNLSCVLTEVNKKSSTILIGDFNLSDLLWEYNKSKCFSSPLTSDNFIVNKFLDNIFYNNLYQCNNVLNGNGKMLDLVFSTDPTYITINQASIPIIPSESHHPPLQISFHSSSCSTVKYNKILSYNFAKCDYESLNSALELINWSVIWEGCLHVDDMVEKFYSTLMPLIDRFTPLRKPPNENFPSWFSLSLIKALKEKAKYHRKYKMYENAMDNLSYIILKDRCELLLKECYNNFINNAPKNLRRDPLYFWRIFKEKKSNSTLIPNEMNLNKEKAVGGQKICNLFSKHFQSVYNLGQSTSSFTVQTSSTTIDNKLSFGQIIVDEEIVLKQLQSINIHKPSGPDGLSPLFLKKCALNLHKPLAKLYNRSLESGIFPSKWKEAYITPIHKGGDARDVTNYRPISLLSISGKILESIVNKNILYHIRRYINCNQHGFLPGRSTTSNLVPYVSDIAEGLDKQKEVHAIY